MKMEYERACREAGMAEGDIKKIRDYLDAEKKRLKRRKGMPGENMVLYFSDACASGDFGKDGMEIPDWDANVEEEAIPRLELEMLQEAMKELEPEERRLLYVCFSESWGGDARAAREFGISRQAAAYRRKKLVGKLREKMLGRKTLHFFRTILAHRAGIAPIKERGGISSIFVAGVRTN